MIDRQDGKILFECDQCDEVWDSGTSDFQEAWAAAKREGWRTRKIGTEWVHACPSCEFERS